MHQYHFKWFPGSIRKFDEYRDLIVESKTTEENITIYSVYQSGYIETFEITPNSAIVEDPLIFMKRLHHLLVFDIKNYEPDRMSGRYIMGSGGESEDGEIPTHPDHRAFTCKRSAEEYSNWMKTDPDYIEEVRAYHARHNEMSYRFFNRFDSDDLYD